MKYTHGDGTTVNLVTDEEVQPKINSALKTAKESGEFNGQQGDPGKTPVKGIDYFTDDDISEIAEQAASLIGDTGGAFNGKPLISTTVSGGSLAAGIKFNIPFSNIYATDKGGVVRVVAAASVKAMAFEFVPPLGFTIQSVLSAKITLTDEKNGYVATLTNNSNGVSADFSFSGGTALQVLSYGSYLLGSSGSGSGEYIEVEEAMNADAGPIISPESLTGNRLELLVVDEEGFESTVTYTLPYNETMSNIPGHLLKGVAGFNCVFLVGVEDSDGSMNVQVTSDADLILRGYRCYTAF